MNYRILGKTGLKVSEIGFGGEWVSRHSDDECLELFRTAEACGINIVDCWMADPVARDKIGLGLKGHREQWFVQGHVGAIWKNGQYERSRNMTWCKPAFEDLLKRLGTNYIDLGMIHYVDEEAEFASILDSDYLKYVQDLKANGVIRHIGMSTHNPKIGTLAVEHGLVEMMLFSINPAFDLMPTTENVDDFFVEDIGAKCTRLNRERMDFYNLCARENVGLTVMKAFSGGRLFDAKRSPFGVALTPLQCLHYALTRPAVAAVMAGYDTPEQIREAASYSTASDEELDYASVLAKALYSTYQGQCTYCGHCLPCPKKIDIAMVNKLYDLAVQHDEIPSSLREHYRNLTVHADECIGCRACEKRCPFGVGIAQRMKDAAELFK